MWNGAPTQHLSSVKPLQLLSSRLPGHQLLLLPPLSLWAKLWQGVHGDADALRYIPRSRDRYFTNLPARRRAVIVILAGERLLWSIAGGLFGGEEQTQNTGKYCTVVIANLFREFPLCRQAGALLWPTWHADGCTVKLIVCKTKSALRRGCKL